MTKLHSPSTAAVSRRIREAAERDGALLRSTLQEAVALKMAIRNAKADGDLDEHNRHLRRLRGVLRDHPTAWRLSGDLARKSALALAHFVAGGDEYTWASVLAGLDHLRADLGYAQAPTLERLLIDQVALAWLNYEATKACYAALAFKGGVAPEHGPYWERRMASVEKRYQRAVESLARTQKLLRSTKVVQVNYAHQQVVHNTFAHGEDAAGHEADPATDAGPAVGRRPALPPAELWSLTPYEGVAPPAPTAPPLEDTFEGPDFFDETAAAVDDVNAEDVNAEDWAVHGET